MVRGEPLSQAAPDSSPTEGSLWRNRSLCGDCQGLSYFVGKSGSWHRFLYLFVEVYGILILHPVPSH